MAAELIGRCRCPVCRSEKGRLTLARSQLAVLTCNGCNFQGFSRSERSDELLRALLIADTPPADPVREPAPAPVRTAPPPTNPPAATPPAPAPRRTGWGMSA